MKKFTIFSFCMLLTAAVFAQIPNNDFENWSTPNGQTYRNPDGWQTTTDILKSLSSDTVNVYKDSVNFFSGTSSVKMITKSITFENVTGGIASGNMTLSLAGTPKLIFSGGFPFTAQPGQLTGYYMYTKAGTDSYSMEAILTKWNGSKRDTIALAYNAANDNETSFQHFSLNLNYLTLSEAPDTAFIAFFSTAAIIGTAGTTLWVDDISFAGTAGTNDIKNSDVVSVFPNPAQNTVYINAVPGQFREAIIYDITGRLVGTKAVNGNSINVNDLANGNYIIMLSDKHNNLSKSIVAINR